MLHQKKEYEKRIECQFEAFCKKVLRNEARKCYRELKRQRGREIPLEEIVVNHVQLLHYKLDFSVGHDFLAFGVPITIHDERLADKLISPVPPGPARRTASYRRMGATASAVSPATPQGAVHRAADHRQAERLSGRSKRAGGKHVS